MTLKYKNICLIGMSGIGKSSFGKKIASELNIPFIDTDLLLQKSLQDPLQAFLANNEESEFLRHEEATILNMAIPKPSIIATGGSVVYSNKAMLFLKKHCHIIYLKDSLENITSRVQNYEQRAIVTLQQSSLEAVFEQREQLYEKWADHTITFPQPFSIKSILFKIYAHINH